MHRQNVHNTQPQLTVDEENLEKFSLFFFKVKELKTEIYKNHSSYLQLDRCGHYSKIIERFQTSLKLAKGIREEPHKCYRYITSNNRSFALPVISNIITL